jgi:hypothetical protein
MFWRVDSLYCLNVRLYTSLIFSIVLNKNEMMQLVEAAEMADGSKVGQAYLEGRREKKNRLK